MITTERMRLIPYTKTQIELALIDLRTAALSIGADFADEPASDEIEFKRGIYGAKLQLMKEQPDSWLFSTIWQMVLDGTIAGEIGFKGIWLGGEVELGYSTRERFRRRGLMTEAVGALSAFAFGQEQFRIMKISASTMPDNIGSARVLEKNGFVPAGKMGKLINWVKLP